MSYIDKSYIKLLIKQREVSKHYKNDCLLNSCLLFMCLLTAPVAVKKHILGQNLLYLSKIGPKLNFNSLLIPNFDLTGKELQSKAIFSTCLLLNYSNFRFT